MAREDVETGEERNKTRALVREDRVVFRSGNGLGAAVDPSLLSSSEALGTFGLALGSGCRLTTSPRPSYG